MFICVNTVSDKVVGHSPAYLSVQKWFAEHTASFLLTFYCSAPLSNSVRGAIQIPHCDCDCDLWSPTTRKFDRNWPTHFKNANFLSIFARSASAV